MKPLSLLRFVPLVVLLFLSGCDCPCEPLCEAPCAVDRGKLEPLKEDNPDINTIDKPPHASMGSLKGVVKLDGPVPTPEIIQAPAAFPECNCPAAGIPNESLVVDAKTKGLKWAIIRLTPPETLKMRPLLKAKKAPELNLKGCMFSPHVIIVPPGVDIEVLNPDKITYNIHSLPYDSDNVSVNLPLMGAANWTYKAAWLKDPDLIEVKDDIHNWMRGFIVCHDPRLCAISAADGTFEIKNLPPGDYKLNIWHEKFGNYMKKESIDITIKASAAMDLGEVKMQARH